MSRTDFYEEDTQACRYLTFLVDGTVFGIEIAGVSEIIQIMPITEVPEAPPYLKGVVNLRGKVLPVMDLRIKFGKPPAEYTDRTCIIVVVIQGVTVGLIVDGVCEVVFIPDEDIVPPPSLKAVSQNKYITGIGKVGDDVKLIVDCDEILKEEEINELKASDF
ncbi:MAG: purine-binding chemotaxis protein CheW [Clostridiales bacterium]|nr:purine-binding chemotaxis protein CheW [Clostridiales bacterium]